MALIDRFSGADGRRLLVDALSSQAIFLGERPIAEEIAEVAILQEYSADAIIIEQGAADHDIFFIIVGSTSILIHGRQVNTRGPGQHVGEMALIDPSATRSATVVAREPTLVARVSEPNFVRIADKYPKVWRCFAMQLAERLRQSNL
jgi:CRP/FNR family cyclic AMP-dependent transcriptional regulator